MNQSRTIKHQLKRNEKRQQLRKKIIPLFILLCIIIAGLLVWYSYPLLTKEKAPSTSKQPVDAHPAEQDFPSGDPQTPSPSGSSGGGGTDNPDTKDEIELATPGQSGSDSGNTPIEAEHVSFTFVGDVLLGNNVEPILKQNGYDYPYREVRSYLSDADLTIANLESPITLRGEPEDKTYVYRSSPEVLPAFVEAGFDLVNLANNHILDYGQEGLLDTFDHLDDAGVKWVGAGRDVTEAYQPEIIEKNGIKIAVLGFSHVVPNVYWKAEKNHPGVAETYDYRKPVEAIAKVRKEVDLVVILAHWGEERNDKPVSHQTEMARRYIDAGADLVIGSHPHVLQGFEQYKGKWIAYSLGNFIFTTNNNPITHQSAILDATCSRDGGCELKLTPIYTYYAKPVVMEDSKAEELRQKLTQISIDAKVTEDWTIETIR